MSNKVSAIVSGMGVAMGFITSLMEEIRERGGTDEDIYRLVKPEGRKIVGQIADFVVQSGKVVTRAVTRIIAVFTITCIGTPASELVKKGEYDWVYGGISDERFPLKPHSSVIRKIELVEFADHNPPSDEVLAEFKRLGLERPTYEDALQFGVENPDGQRERPIVFLHEPVRGSLGGLRVLVLDGDAGRRGLDLDWFGVGWNRGCVFAGVRK